MLVTGVSSVFAEPATIPKQPPAPVTSGYDPGLPNVTLEQATNKIEKKGFELVEFLQRIAKPFIIVMFIIGCFMAIVGSIFRSPAGKAGFIVMLLSGIVYIGILNAPEIMDFFINWAQS